jgi:hypothetical protein
MNRGQQGDAILQPGAADGGTQSDRIATLADYVPLDFGTAPPECPFAEWSVKLLNAVAGAFGSSHRLRAVKQTAGVNRVDAALARPLSPDRRWYGYVGDTGAEDWTHDRTDSGYHHPD